MIRTEAAPPPALTASKLRLAYGSHTVVHEASLQVRAGEVLALVGPNGSGKSTLLRGMARLHGLSSGALHLATGGSDAAQDDGGPVDSVDCGDPVDCLTLSPRRFATRLAMLTQHRPTPAGMSVREIVGLGRHPHRSRWTGADPAGLEAVRRAMALTGVDELAERSIDELSGGQVQRVWLASCLAQQTPVLLLDEPTNHLDLRYQSELLDLIRDLADDHGVAIGVVLHDLNQAATVADRVVLLVDGAIVAEGTPTDVLTEQALTRAYQTPIEVIDSAGLLQVRPLPRCATRQRLGELIA
ncbi:ABC transporter ATP-binding protein [Aestuariimicrobium kwangyangense]|uniref:ABC transporter ATP-binding protein n=1 Tax=Aestuariimicrobium kwangyangense TaxID=396389 RepID=UPI0003B5F778|nr:ABC transporter ATP-binding protein [Aestuariimicrobium kwangyangense]